MPSAPERESRVHALFITNVLRTRRHSQNRLHIFYEVYRDEQATLEAASGPAPPTMAVWRAPPGQTLSTGTPEANAAGSETKDRPLFPPAAGYYWERRSKNAPADERGIVGGD